MPAKPRTKAPSATLSVHEREAIKAVVSTAVALLARDDVHVDLTAAARTSIEATFAEHIRRP